MGEVQSIDFSGLTVATAGNITVGTTVVALAAGDGPAAIAAKVKTALEALTTEIGSVTQAGSKLTVNYLPYSATGTDLNPSDTRLTVATDAANSPVTFSAGTIAATNDTIAVVTSFENSDSITVTVNGVDYVAPVTVPANVAATAVAAPTAPTVVTTQGVQAVTAVAPVLETSVVTFNSMAAGEKLFVGGLILTAGTGGLTALQVASAFSSGTAPTGSTFTGALTGFTAGSPSGAAVIFTQTGTAGPVTDLALASAPVAPAVTVTTQGTSGVAEVSTVTFGALSTRQAVTFAGRTLTATAPLTASEVASAFATVAPTITGGTISGTLSGTTSVSGAIVTHTAAANGPATDLTVTATGPTLPAVTTVDGVAAVTGVTAVTESSVVTFGALAKGQSVTVAGVTVTATAAMTAAEVTTAMLALTPTGFTDEAVAGSTNQIKYTSSTPGQNVNDIVVSTAGSGSTADRATAQANTVAAVKGVLDKVLAGAVTVTNGDEAGELKLTSNAVGVELPSVTVSQGTVSRSSIDTADGATVANAVRTQVAAAKQVFTITIAEGTSGIGTSASFELFVNGVSYGVTALGAGDANSAGDVAIILAKAINSALKATSDPVAVAVGGTVTVTAPVAGTALPLTPNSKLASVTTGAGADTILLNTATAADNVGTTVTETISASLSSGAGNDRLVVATTGTGKTTVDASDGNDTVYLNSVGSGEASNYTVGGVAKENVVFHFGGNTYVYVDNGANGLTDSDQLVQLSGTLNLDLLLQAGVITNGIA